MGKNILSNKTYKCAVFLLRYYTLRIHGGTRRCDCKLFMLVSEKI